MKIRHATPSVKKLNSDLNARLWRIIAVLFALYATTVHASAALAGVAPNPTVGHVRVPPNELKGSAVSATTVVLTWRPAAPLDMKWIAAEKWNWFIKTWAELPPRYVSNETTRFEYDGLEGSTTYRFIVCGIKGDKNGHVTTPQVCTRQITVQTPVALDSRGAVLIQPRIPPVFAIGPITPSAAGFQPCTRLTGLVGRYISGSIQLSDLSSSICALGSVTITQTNPKVNMTGQKIRLFVTHEAFDGSDYNTSGQFYTRNDVFEMAFVNNNPVTFQVALASGRGPRPDDVDVVKAHIGKDERSLNVAANFQGSEYAKSSCTYNASPVAVSCK